MKGIGNQLFPESNQDGKMSLWQKEKCNPISTLFLVHNEEKVIEQTIIKFTSELRKHISIQIIVAEDGSTDGTKKVLNKLSKRISMKLVTNKNKKGYMKATKDGLFQTNSEFVFITDSDGQFIPSDFWRLYTERNNYDIIVGWKKNRADSPWRLIIANTFHLLIRRIFDLPIHDPNTAFRIINKKVLDDITKETQYLKYSFWTEFSVRAFKKGYTLKEIEITHKKRIHGKSQIYSQSKIPNMLLLQLFGLFKLWKSVRITKKSN